MQWMHALVVHAET